MAGADSEVPIADLSGERVRWYHSLRTRIALWSGLLTLLFLLAVTLATAWYLRREILDSAQRDTRAQAASPKPCTSRAACRACWRRGQRV